jgi:DMSO/TMAO reductase YedYZ heme-binding membrane subunit
MNNTIVWYATRGAGAVSLLLLSAVVGLGIVSVMRWQTPGWPRFLSSGLHRNLALIAMIFLGLHIVTAVVDPFTALGWNAALTPFSSSYRRLWLGLGAVALDLLLAIVVTSLLRRYIGPRAWRVVHWLTYACWPIAVVHGIGTGSDTRYAWMLAIDAVCIGAVIGVATWRIQSRFRKVASPMLVAEVINQ